jgi:REP element-mobilizing transposase RayT
MAKPPRILLPKSLVFITSRVQSGLPFVAHKLMNEQILGIIGRAQYLYEVKICALLFMGNHFHMLAIVTNKESIPAFMRRIKTETALLVNKYLDRRQQSVWCAGYDCVPILTPEDAINKFVYLYTNPQRAKICQKIEHYGGLSTWDSFIKDKKFINCSWKGRQSVVSVAKKETQTYQFEISSLEWIDIVFNGCYKATEAKERIVYLVQEFQKNYCIKKIPESIKNDLKKEINKNKEFQPKKFGQRMWCICSDVSKRIDFIKFIKHLRQIATRVFQKWKKGDYSEEYPLEFFSPRRPSVINLIQFSYAN